jgi:hypothetical protein
MDANRRFTHGRTIARALTTPRCSRVLPCRADHDAMLRTAPSGCPSAATPPADSPCARADCLPASHTAPPRALQILGQIHGRHAPCPSSRSMRYRPKRAQQDARSSASFPRTPLPFTPRLVGPVNCDHRTARPLRRRQYHECLAIGRQIECSERRETTNGAATRDGKSWRRVQLDHAHPGGRSVVQRAAVGSPHRR